MKPKITIAKNAGFCFGVKRAYGLACANSKNCSDVYILGKLVHNDDVCRDLGKRGIKEIKSLSDIKEGTVIFTAHGVGPSLYQKAAGKNVRIIDTTCPKVTKVQGLAKNFAGKGYQILLFGDKNHKEVESIKEWSGNKALVVSTLKDLKVSTIVKNFKSGKNKKYCLLSQTTQNVQEFKKIAAYLKKYLKNFVYFNTICPSTDDRQKEVRALAKANDAVIVIGGRDSANSRRLWEIASQINPKACFIDNEKKLGKNWLKDLQKIAITAGASTPAWVIKKVSDKIRRIA